MPNFLKYGFFLMLLVTGMVQAQLFSPGPLAKNHAELNGLTNCVKCHSGDRDKACLTCHKEIQKKITDNKGFHAKQQNKLKKSCVSCHSEHKGENYDLTGLSRNPFDHKETAWPLMGKHLEVKCDKCHTQKRSDVAATESKATTYLMAASQCISCHKKSDAHDGIFGSQCESCHVPLGWKTIVSVKPNENKPSTPAAADAAPTPFPTAPPIP